MVAVFPLLVAIIFSVIGYAIALNAKGNQWLHRRPGKLRKFVAPVPKAEVLQRLAAAAKAHQYGVEVVSLPDSAAVFSSSVGMFSWGFFFPCYITEAPAGCIVEVGIASRFFQWGPVVTAAHNKFVEKMQETLGAQIAA